MKRYPITTILIVSTIVALTALFCGALVVLMLSFMPDTAHAQAGAGSVFSPRESSRMHGEYIIGWNATASQINDGTLVMADTSSSTSLPQVAIGKGFSTWNGVPANARRIIGVLIGNVAGGSQGRIMTRGFHPWVKLAATGYTGNTVLKPSLTVIGAMASVAASETTAVGMYYKFPVGVFQRYASVDSLRGYVWIDMSGKR